MQVKIFVSGLTMLADGSDSGTRLIEIEHQINGWLKSNPEAEVIDVRLAGLSGAVGATRTEFALVALVMYRPR